MLSTKKLLYHIVNALSNGFGAVGTNPTSYGAVTSVTPNRAGWLVIYTKTGSSAPTNAPAIRVFSNSACVAHFVDLALANSDGYFGIPVKKGVKYDISVYRTTLMNVLLYS